jgi:hypothetical protein
MIKLTCRTVHSGQDRLGGMMYLLQGDRYGQEKRQEEEVILGKSFRLAD